ncbi:MAG: oligosaccharide flippase family protein [Oscillospiraceae bacterium]|jgi:stage V sporulation protein B|nr:oligosaccharide flippase family protein [Oscillospiraceae bacterium]
MKKHSLVKQTALLSGANTVVRAVGFAMRIWLSRVMGAEAMGVLELASSAHMLWIAPVTSGIPMAVAREAAAGQGLDALRAGRRLALKISLWMLPLLLLAAPLIAPALGDARTLPALLLYLPCLPVLGLSAAYNGYCYGAGNTLPPALSEIVEQSLRFIVCIGILMLITGMTAAWTAAVPPFATLVGEAVSVVMVGWMLRRGGIQVQGRAPRALEQKIWRLAVPMTAMRVTNTLMRTVNAVLIPLRLRLSGLSAQEATARLGMFSGMAMPLVMLPSVVTGALAMVAGPAMARHEKNPLAMRRMLLRVMPAALAVSVAAAGGMILGAPWIAQRLYRQPDLQELLIALAPLVPVMGLQQVAGGMLAGLGRQRSALVSSLTGALLTLALNYWLVPSQRLIGCVWAQTAGHAVTLVMNMRILLRVVRRRVEDVM